MALFESGNPTLSQKFFDRSRAIEAEQQGVMSVRGTMNKFGFVLLMLLGGAAYNWHLYETYNQSTMNILMMAGIFGGFICAIVISFKPNWAPYITPLYGILEGLFIGGISAILNNAFKEKYPGLIMQAVGLTFGVAFSMFILYNFRIIKATQKLKSMIMTATLGVGIFYLITIVMSWFHISMPFMYDGSTLGIGISLVIVAIAAMNLILDFDLIEQGAETGAPKFMEWYGAFALMVTMVWLYIEILKLLTRFAGNKN